MSSKVRVTVTNAETGERREIGTMCEGDANKLVSLLSALEWRSRLLVTVEEVA